MPNARAGVMITTIMENEAVKVEKVILKPGTRTGFHAEGVAYTMVACSQGRTIRLDKDGKFLELLYLEPGLHIQRKADFAHDVINVSESDVVMLKIYQTLGAKDGKQRGARTKGS